MLDGSPNHRSVQLAPLRLRTKPLSHSDENSAVGNLRMMRFDASSKPLENSHYSNSHAKNPGAAKLQAAGTASHLCGSNSTQERSTMGPSDKKAEKVVQK